MDSPKKKTIGFSWSGGEISKSALAFEPLLALRQAEAWMGGYDEVWTGILKMENHPAVASSMGYSGNLASGPENGYTEFRYAKFMYFLAGTLAQIREDMSPEFRFLKHFLWWQIDVNVETMQKQKCLVDTST